MSKIRLDLVLQSQFPHYSRRQIQSWIMQGKVMCEGKVLDKAGELVWPDAQFICNFDEPKYVSRAGFKLEKALDHFKIDVTDLVVLDAGISTGGFTDCLVQRGVRTVYGIDVGYGQVHEKIRDNTKVVLKERTNLRYVRDVGELVDLVTLDLSFISIIKVIDAVCSVLKNDGCLITLIKPQFEASKAQVGRGGIIKDEKIHQEIVERVTRDIKNYGFMCHGVIESPIEGAMGNKEFLGYFTRVD